VLVAWATSDAAAASVVTSEGASPVVGDNRVRARQRAIDEAARQAVELTARGLLAGAPTVVLSPDQELTLKRDVLPRARGLLRSFRVLFEAEEPNPGDGGAPGVGTRYRVRLEAEVDDVALGAQLRRGPSASAAAPLGTPARAGGSAAPGPSVPASTAGGPVVAVAAIGGPAAVVAALQQAAVRALQGRGISARAVPLRLGGDGLDEAAARAAALAASGATAAQGSSNEAATQEPPPWPTDSEVAGWLLSAAPTSGGAKVVGGLLVRVDQVRRYGLRATTQWGAEALVRVKVVQVPRGDVGDAAGTDARWESESAPAGIAAATGALELALGRIGEVLARLARVQPEPSGELEVALQGAFLFSDVQRLSQRLVAAVGEPSVELRRLGRDGATFAVRGGVDGATLARRLSQSVGQPLGNELVAEPSGPRSVRVRVAPDLNRAVDGADGPASP
jgi:hypothetical protein